jgi:hypothetical protein
MGLIELLHSSQVQRIDIDALKSLADGNDQDF